MRTLLFDVQRGLKEGLADASKVSGATDPKVVAYSCSCSMIPEVCVCAQCVESVVHGQLSACAVWQEINLLEVFFFSVPSSLPPTFSSPSLIAGVC
jgi:hypothetical protein